MRDAADLRLRYGFNLYYGALRKTPYKWLNIKELAETILPNNSITRVKYFTARVQGRGRDPEQPQRQEILFRAFRTVPEIEIHLGHFLTKPALMARFDGLGMVKVWKTEEKGSDVNLAVHLLHDACRRKFETAVIISNDSDLVEAIRIVTGMGLKVGVVFPVLTDGRKKSVELGRAATFVREIRKGHLAASQFAAELTDSDGSFHKPRSWA